MPRPLWRKIYFVNPRSQGGAALLFSSVFLIGGVIFGLLLHRHMHQALLNASLQGHYAIVNASEIVRGPLLWHVVSLFAGVFLVSAAVFRFLLRAIHRCVERIAEVFRASEGGDLSTPSDSSSLAEFARFGSRVDAVRALTLEQIDGVRQEVALLASGERSREEFRLHWDMLKQRIRRIAP